MRALLLLFFLTSTTMAQVSLNVALTSDYVWRGFSQTDENPALQLGVDWEHGSGFYLGSWGSNVDFDDETAFEVDGWAGFQKTLENGLTLDLGYIYYTFEDDAAGEFGEAYISLGYKGIDTKYSRDFDNENTYLEAAYSWQWAKQWRSSLHLGQYDFDNTDDNVYDWSFSLSYTLRFLDIEIAYWDTDFRPELPTSDDRIVLTLSKTW